MINEAIGWIDGRLIEPFVGSAVVSLNIEAVGYILADLNADLINLYDVLKAQGDTFVFYCEEYFKPKMNTEEVYYKLRNEFNDTQDYIDRAALFVYLNRHTFNGLCRFNGKGRFNVPFGKYDKVGFPKKEMLFFLKKAEKFEFYCQDFEKTIAMAKPGDVVYADPPYVPLNDTAYFNDYTGEGFTIDQQIRLAELAEQSPCKFLISNHDTEETRELYKNADRILTRDVGRFVGAKVESRKPVAELLAIYKG